MTKTADQIVDEATKIIYSTLVEYVKSDQSSITAIWDRGDLEEFSGEALTQVTNDIPWTCECNKAAARIDKIRVSAWEKMFKAEFGMSSAQFVKQLIKDDEKTIAPHEVRFLKTLGNYLLDSVTVLDLKQGYMQMYMKSPTSLVIKTDAVSGIVLTDEALKDLNMGGIKDTVAFLEKMGVKMGKRPKHKKILNSSIYD